MEGQRFGNHLARPTWVNKHTSSNKSVHIFYEFFRTHKLG